MHGMSVVDNTGGTYNRTSSCSCRVPEGMANQPQAQPPSIDNFNRLTIFVIQQAVSQFVAQVRAHSRAIQCLDLEYQIFSEDFFRLGQLNNGAEPVFSLNATSIKIGGVRPCMLEVITHHMFYLRRQ